MRGSFDIRHTWLALTLAAWLAACGSTRPGIRSSPEPPQTALPQTTVTDTVREGAPPASPASSSATVSADSTGFGSARSSTTEPSSSPPFASPPSPRSEASSDDTLDRQFEILNDAVAALREEAARSYGRAQELGVENERLRSLVASLRRDLRKNRDANKSLKNHLQALEKRLHEINSPPPEEATTVPETRGAVSPEERSAPAPPPPPQPPEGPPSPPPAPNPGDAARDTGSGAPPEDDSD